MVFFVVFVLLLALAASGWFALGREHAPKFPITGPWMDGPGWFDFKLSEDGRVTTVRSNPTVLKDPPFGWDRVWVQTKSRIIYRNEQQIQVESLVE